MVLDNSQTSTGYANTQHTGLSQEISDLNMIFDANFSDNADGMGEVLMSTCDFVEQIACS